MPWTEKQLRLFRAAAHNPEIAKRTGIKQSDAERMSKEGLKKMASGGKALINRQDTRHGKVDMPFTKLGRFAGMKKGGFMKKRRYDEGGDVGSLEDEGFTKEGEGEDTVYRKSFVSTPSYKKEVEKAVTKPAAKAVTKPAAKAVTQPAAKDLRTPLDFQRMKERDTYLENRREKEGLRSKFDSPIDLRTVLDFQRMRERDADLKKRRAMEDQRRAVEDKFNRTQGNPAAAFTYKKGGLMRPKKDIGKDQMSMAPYKKGGEMESKSMMKKEISFMKKKGAPKSMIKHEEAEAKGYKKGGSIKETMGPRGMGKDVEGGYKAKHLKHGEHSEQKRGHTKGTVIKMAAGGSVRAHGEHSIQLKGHTRGKMC